MMLSRGRRYIFIHIPKTGGTAMAQALEARAMADDVMIGDTPKAVKRRGRLKGVTANGRLWKHSTLADIEGLASAEEIADFFTVTLVRNPWDRLVSYYHWLQAQGFDHPAVQLAKTHDFSGFLAQPSTQASFRQWPARRYMTDLRGVERASLYVRLEAFEQDIKPFEAHLGFGLELPIVNQSKRATGWRDYYSESDRALVESLCSEDISRFGYEF